MGRPHRAAQGGLVYHVLNRANARMAIFEKEGDYDAFENVLEEAVDRTAMRLLAYCVMPNHWHLVVWPKQDRDLSRFTGWLTRPSPQRRQRTCLPRTFQIVPCEEDEHLLTVCRYVERNALRANLAKSAEAWRWGSLWRWSFGDTQQKKLISKWPVRRSPGWLKYVNEAHTESELQAIHRSVARGNPYGSDKWSDRMIKKLGLQSTHRPRGRPRKQE